MYDIYYYVCSEYHERCVTEKPGRQFTPKPPMTKAELRKADVVSQDKIWREAVTAETDAAGKWQNAWGFLLDYDSKVLSNLFHKSIRPSLYTDCCD